MRLLYRILRFFEWLYESGDYVDMQGREPDYAALRDLIRAARKEQP